MSNTLTEILNQTKLVSELVVFSGRSGSGKTSLMNKIIKMFNNIELPNVYHSSLRKSHKLSIRKAKKYTTRDKRIDDDPNEFIYVTKQEFKELAENGEIAVQYQSAGVGDFFYGWSEDQLSPRANEIVIASANDEAVAKDLKYLHKSTNIFMDVSQEELEKRIISRGGLKEQIESRIRKLSNQHKTLAYDIDGNEKICDMDSHFYGAQDQIEGIANIVVENYGSIELAAKSAFEEILKLVTLKRNVLFVPKQKKLKVDVINDKDVLDVETISTEDMARPSGKSFYRGDLVNKNREGYEYIINLGVVIDLVGGKDRQYVVRLNHKDEKVDVFLERSVMFRGSVFRPLETWGAPEGTNISQLYEDMSELGMIPPRRMAGNYQSDEVEVISSYLCGDPSYKQIRHIFEENKIHRMV